MLAVVPQASMPALEGEEDDSEVAPADAPAAAAEEEAPVDDSALDLDAVSIFGESENPDTQASVEAWLEGAE